MGTTQPIRDKKELKRFTAYYKEYHPHCRNYALIVLGLNTALRISDLLHLTWGGVYDFEKHHFRDHLLVIERKTGKRNYIVLNRHATGALAQYFDERTPSPEDYIFSKRTSVHSPLCRSQAYRIIRKAAGNSMKEEHISCHSLRKTFGYHAWQQGTQPALLMDIFNHSSYRVTKRYLGIEQDEKDSIFMKIEL